MGDFFKVELQQVARVPPITDMDHVPVTDLYRRVLLLLHDIPALTGISLAKDLGIGPGTVKEICTA